MTLIRYPFPRTAVLFALFAAAPYAAGTTPQLRITSPSDGAVVNPGQTITVRVESASRDEFSHVGVVAESPLGFSEAASSVPATFSFTVPDEIACRTYMLTAVGVTASGEQSESATILIDVERPDPPKSLSTLLPSIGFGAAGEASLIKILATFADGKVLDVTESRLVQYSSSNSHVVTVERYGKATAVAAGTATITVTYNAGGRSVQLAIPVTVPAKNK